MSYIGVPPQATFSSGLLDRFTSTTGTTVTLTHDIASENDIVVFVNFVKQDSTTYSVGGTGNKTLTLGGTLVSSDIVEVHYLNIVGQTNVPSSGSVGSSQLTADSITGQTAETSIADDDTIMIHDTSASALRKMTKANFTSGIGGDNTPSFIAHLNADQSISNTTYTTITFTETFDSDNAFASNTFTVPSGEAGKYYVSLHIRVQAQGNDIVIATIKNGTSQALFGRNEFNSTNYALFSHNSIMISGILDLSVGDTLTAQVYGKTFDASATTIQGNTNGSETWFHGYKLIGV